MRAGWTSIGALLLAGCDRSGYSAEDAFDLADAAQANARTALGQNEDQESRIDDLEQKVRDLESQLSSLESTVSDNARIANENGRIMDQRWETYRQHTHY